MKAVIYTRVSTKEQVEEGNSLATQERICREYADKQDIEIVQVFVERGESAKTANRTRLKDMMAYAANRRNQIDAIIFYKLDRLTRDTNDFAQLRLFFESVNVALISTSEQFDNTPAGRFMQNVTAAHGQFDNENRAERSRNGMIDAISAGRWPWKAPVGYINGRAYGKRNIVLTDNQEQLRLIRKIFDLVASGVQPESGRRIINDEGFTNDNGKPLSKSHLYKMLENPLYKGVVEGFGLSVVSEVISPIVDPVTFDLALLKYKGRTDEIDKRKYMTSNPLFPLRNVLNCINGHHMTGSSPRGNGGVYPKYHCSKCRGKGTSHNKDFVESKFVDYLQQFSYDKSVMELLTKAIEANWDHRTKEGKKRSNKLYSELVSLDTEQKILIRKNIKGVISDEILKQMLNDLTLEKTNIQLELNEIQFVDEDILSLISYGFNKLTNIGNLWDSIEDIDVKQRFQKWLFPAGIEFDGDKFGTTALPLSLTIKKDLSEEKSLLVTSRRIELRLPG